MANNNLSQELDKSIKADIKHSSIEEKSLLLFNKNIAISVSDVDEIEQLGFSKVHLQDMTLEITRYLLINGATLLYGGDLRAQGFTFMFSELVKQYTINQDKKFYKNFFSFPIYNKLSKADQLDFKKFGVEIIKVAPPEELNVDLNQFYPPTNNENLYIWSESLSKMRKEMSKDSDARIFIGGAKSNFKGKYPGLLEEAVLSLQKDLPIYFIGAFGGITNSIINCLIGENPKELTEEWQLVQNEMYKEFVMFYNNKDDVDKIDYQGINSYLGAYSLERLSDNNGLSIDDNVRLFESIHLPEIIYLILKGLKNKFRS